jgi:hypothetical protein
MLIAGMVAAFGVAVMPYSVNTTLTASSVDRLRGLEFTMALQKTIFKIGEPVNITFTITNIGSVTYNFLHSFPEFDFIVYDSLNRQLYRDTAFKGFPTIAWTTPLYTGENYTTVLVWHQTSNQSIDNNEGTPVSPGQYSIVGIFFMCMLQTSPLQIIIGR